CAVGPDLLVFLFLIRLAPSSTLFPYTTLFRSCGSTGGGCSQSFQNGTIFVSASGEARAIANAAVASYYQSKGGAGGSLGYPVSRSEEHTSELQSRENLVCRLLLEKKKVRLSNT